MKKITDFLIIFFSTMVINFSKVIMTMHIYFDLFCVILIGLLILDRNFMRNRRLRSRLFFRNFVMIELKKKPRACAMEKKSRLALFEK